MQALFAALRGNQDATNAFLSAITGAIPLPDFMSDENLGRIMAAAKSVDIPVLNQLEGVRHVRRSVRSCTANPGRSVRWSRSSGPYQRC